MAATTHVINGTDYILEVTDDDGSSYQLVGHLTTASIEATMETRDVTTKSSAGWRELREGLRSWNGSADGYIRNDAEASVLKYQDLYGFFNTRTKFGIRLTNANTGDYEFVGDVYITSLSAEAPMEDNFSYSMSFEGSGPLSYNAQV